MLFSLRAQSLGDGDCGEWLIPEPAVLTCMLPDDGCDIIIASDGLWDALALPDVYALVERWVRLALITP